MNPGIYKLSSLLIQYPDKELIELLPDIADAAKDLPRSQRGRIDRVVSYLSEQPPVELQQSYVSCFDFNKKSTLYLSFHGYGDRRQRGMAMLQLKRRYAALGLELNEGELPDYLPVLLEFVAYASADQAAEVLQQFRAALELVRAALSDEKSIYTLLLEAILETLPKLNKQLREQIEQLAEEGPPSEEVGLEPFAPPSVMPEPTTGCEVA